MNLGNLIEARELGADTFIMAGGVGPCRFGLYGQLENDILKDLGYEYDYLILEPPDKGMLQFLNRIKKVLGGASWWKIFRAVRFAYRKANLVDELEKIVQYMRPREFVKGTADRIFTYSLMTIDQAKNNEELSDAYGLSKEKLLHIPHDNQKEVLKIGLVGEIYTLLDPFASQEIEKKLGYLGASVTRSIYISDWISDHLLIGLFKKEGHRNFKMFASPFLNHTVGGHGQESIGAAVAFAREGFHGIVQLAPLTCMPEIVAHTIFPRVSEIMGVPVLTIYVDEQSGQEGINTRLEAFIDLLSSRVSSLDRKTTVC